MDEEKFEAKLAATVERVKNQSKRTRKKRKEVDPETHLLPPSGPGSRDRAFAGVSGRTVEKIAAVVAAAEHNPREFGVLVEEMDRTGRANGVHRKLKIK